MDNPVRRLLLSPSEFANRFQTSETDRILEIGPGSGYFSVELARRVQAGRLELFDLQPEMLAKARRKLVKEAIKNVGYTAGSASERFPFPDNLIRFAELGPMVESAGFVLESRYGPTWNYTAIFRKPLAPSVPLSCNRCARRSV